MVTAVSVPIVEALISHEFAQISTIATCALVCWIGYKGLSQPEIFNQSLYKETIEETEVQTEAEEEILIKESIINDKDTEEFNKIKNALLKLILLYKALFS